MRPMANNDGYYVPIEGSKQRMYELANELAGRVQAGEYTIAEAVPLQVLLETDNPEQFLRPVDSMFRNFPAVTLSAKQEKCCRNGAAFSIQLDAGTYRCYGKDGEFLSLSKVEDGVMSTIKSFFEV